MYKMRPKFTSITIELAKSNNEVKANNTWKVSLQPNYISYAIKLLNETIDP